MATLGIPSAYRDALEWLAELTDDSAEDLALAIGALPAFAAVSLIRDAARSSVEAEAAHSAQLLIPSLLSLRSHVRSRGAGGAAELFRDSPDLTLDESEREKLVKRAEGLLETPAIKTTAIAVDLQTQHAHNFQSARILTDVRPIFDDDLALPPSGVVVSETLQLQTWSREGNAETLFIALDEADLLKLREVVDRGLEKTQTLKAMFRDQGLAYFELEQPTEGD